MTLSTSLEQAIAAFCATEFADKKDQVLKKCDIRKSVYDSDTDELKLMVGIQGRVDVRGIETELNNMFGNVAEVFTVIRDGHPLSLEFRVKGGYEYWKCNNTNSGNDGNDRSGGSNHDSVDRKRGIVGRVFNQTLRLTALIYLILFVYNLYFLDWIEAIEWEEGCHREILYKSGRLNGVTVDPPSLQAQLFIALLQATAQLGHIALGLVYFITEPLFRLLGFTI